MREQYSPELDELRITMLPYKARSYHVNYVPKLERHENGVPTEKTSRTYIDQSDFAELSRKVNWLVEEVQSIKQVLRDWEGGPYERYTAHAHDEFQRSSLRATPSRQSSRYHRPSLSGKSALVRRYQFSEMNAGEYDYESRMKMRVYPYETLSRSDHESHYSSDSPVSTTSKPEQVYSVSECPVVTSRESVSMVTSNFAIPEDINIAEVILLWQRGMNEIPPILSWTQDQKLRHQSKLSQWFRIYHLFKVECNGDIGRFISKYTDSNGKMMGTSYVASLCPDVSQSFEAFFHSNSEMMDGCDMNDGSMERILMLPRKINGRKVSAKDVIQLWEHGMGDIPPIKTWTKAQKFKQQSKISRWKKIVDIFKYQCNSDMKKFEEIYTDAHGCLLPVAAITSKFETIYGDELNITSKLMTVNTAQDSSLETKKRSYEGEDMFGSKKMRSSCEEKDDLPEPPVLIRTSPPMQTSVLNSQLQSNSNSKKPCEEEQIVTTFKEEGSPQNQNTHNIVVESEYTFDEHSSPSNSESETEDKKSELFILFEQTSIQDMITYWERGSSDFPPIKTWLPKQRTKQKDLIEKIEKLYYLYNDVFKRDINALLKACPLATNDGVARLDSLLNEYKQILTERVLPGDTTVISGADSMTFDFSHHKTISQSTDTLYLLPRKINGRKVNAKDVLQLWYQGLNKIPAVKQWSPQQKAVQQSKISRWKKIVDLFEQEYDSNWERFEKQFSNNLGQLLPITAIIAKHEEEARTMRGSGNMFQ